MFIYNNNEHSYTVYLYNAYTKHSVKRWRNGCKPRRTQSWIDVSALRDPTGNNTL